MSCIIDDFRIVNDENDKIKNKLISKITNVRERMGIAARINAGQFLSWALERDDKFRENYEKKGALSKVDGNILGRMLKEYQKFIYPKVENFNSNIEGDSSLGFSSEKAKQEAILHTGNIVNEIYTKELEKPKSDRLKEDEIIKQVSTTIEKNFENRVDAFIVYLDEQGINFPEVENYKKLFIEYNNIKKRVTETVNEFNATTDKKLKKSLKEENLKLKDQGRLVYERLRAERENIVYNYAKPENYPGYNQLRNYLALYRQIKIDNTNRSSTGWYQTVFKHSKLLKYAREFENVLESDIINNPDSEDDASITNSNSENVDETTKSWEDTLAKSYNDYYSTKLKMYLDGLYDLSEPVDANTKDEDISYNTDNELGVPMTKGSAFYINQIANFGDWTSVDNFIESISKASEIKELHSLSLMVRRMRNDRNFAQYVASQTKLVKMKKALVELTNDGYGFVWSNQEMEAGTSMYFNLYHTLKITYKTGYNQYNIATLNRYKNLLDTTLKNPDPTKTKRAMGKLNEIHDFITAYVQAYFPNVDVQSINDWLYKNNDKVLNNYSQLIDRLINLENGIAKFKDVQNDSDIRTNAEYKIYNKKLENYINSGGTETKPEKPVYLFQTESYNKNVSAALRSLAGLIVNNTVVRTELNHANGENKLASDLVKNSYITNILEQIKSGIYTTKEGLNKLYEAVTKSDQFKYNPILFGIKDENGRYVVRGLFDQLSDGTYSINKDAENILDFVLFDGIKDITSNTGTVYQKMSKADYLITQLIAYGNQFSYEKQGKSGIFLRVPSDAGKNFIAETIRYDAKDIFSISSTEYKTFIDGFKDKINKQYKSTIEKEDSQIVTDIKENKKKFLNNNRITVEDAIKLIYNNETRTIDYSTLVKDNSHKDGTVEVPYIVTKKVVENGKEKEINAFVIIMSGKGNPDNVITNATISEIKSLVPDAKFAGLQETDTFKELEDFLTSVNNLEDLQSFALDNELVSTTVNTKSPIFYAFYNQILGELNNFVNQLSNVFEKVDGRYITKTETRNLFDTAHYNGSIVKDGRLTGNFFKFNKLFKVNGVDFSEQIVNILSLYGGTPNSLFRSVTIDGVERLEINTDNINSNNFIIFNPDSRSKTMFKFQITPELNSQLINLLSRWLHEYKKDIHKTYKEYENLIPNEVRGNFGENNILTGENFFTNWILNACVNYMAFDDILEGSTAFYKDAQTFLKRAKEVQMSGTAFLAYDINDDPYQPIKELTSNSIIQNTDGTKFSSSRTYTIDVKHKVNGETVVVPLEVPTMINGKIVKKPMTARNGFRAVAIYNTITAYDMAEDLEKQVYENAIKEGYSKEVANKIAKNISKGYKEQTKVNDAQSYITLDEFIRRKWAEGTLDEYQDILAQLLDDSIELKDLDFDTINKRIQVQKNVYYDIMYDEITGTYYSRQVKNAEFVLIPKLLPEDSDLRKLYDLMVEHDIGQLNTAETLKAAKRNLLTLWDENGVAHFNEFVKTLEDDTVVENFYYRYLYKQQDVVDHMKDERNKAGIQFVKKIQDNASSASQNVRNQIDIFNKNYVANIKESFDRLLFNLGFATENGRIINRMYRTTDENGNPLTEEQIQLNKEALDFSEFYKRARVEAQRLGMDSNFIEYLTPDALGIPIMPNWFNIVQTKIESIAQSIFNSMVARQTLPGWHAAQVTNVGYSKKLKYHPEVYSLNSNSKVKLDKEKYDKLTDEEKKNYTLTQEAYMEVLLPRWSKLLPQRPKDSNLTQEQWDEQLLKQLEEEGLDIHIGYRIPTEGKQSISMLKVVGFLDDAYGSTIIVSNQWVTQTGSDFDIDTVYGIMYEMYRTKDGKFKKIEYDRETEEKDYKRRYIRYTLDYINDRKNAETRNSDLNEVFANARKKIADYNKDLTIVRKLGKLYAEIKEIRDKQENRRVKSDILFINKQGKQNNATEIEINLAVINKLNEDYVNPEYITYQEDIGKLIDLYQAVNDIAEARINNSPTESESNYKSADIKKLRDEAFNEYFNIVANAAKDIHLMSYEDFKTLPIEEQQTQSARNNAIVSAIENILNDPSVLEENLSRSNFDDLSAAKKVREKQAGVGFSDVSPYNPITQLQFFENAINGRKLKAFSVDRDTFNSVNNTLQTRLTEFATIYVKYDLSDPKYSQEIIKKAYGKDAFPSKDGKYIIVKHNRLGWSENNRNVEGKLLTAYSSQTTAHILDAIKEGAVFNETDFTFGMFKTLIDVGIDYDTAITLLLQPAVTLANSFYFQKNSVYSTNNVEPISATVKQILINAGIKVNGNEVTQYTPYSDLIEDLGNNSELMDAFSKQFEVPINEDFSLKNTNIILDKNMLVQRLKQGQSTQDYIKSDGTINYNKVAFDVGIALYLDRLNKTTKTIEKAMRLSNPDSFGARQTVYETRLKLDDAVTIANDPDDTVNKVLFVENEDGSRTGIINALYPGIENGAENIRENESKYPYLAAMMKYCSAQSVNINKHLFKFESDEVYDTIKKAQLALGIRFTADQYADFKKSIVNYIYKQISILNTPVTINDSGFIVLDTESVIEGDKFDYWQDEVSRVYGYYEPMQDEVVVKDPTNPSKDEIKKFNKLTPLQKVLWLQSHIDTSNSIFGFLKCGKYTGRTNASAQYSTNFIRFNDTVNNIEDLLNLFSSAYYSSNPLIRLTAIDLVKYAFIVEGFNFKKGSISKLIKNKILWQHIEDKGMNIVDEAKERFNNIFSINNIYEANWLDNYVRSHQDIVHEVKLGRDKKDLKKVTKLFNECKSVSDLVFIPFTEKYDILLKELNVSKEDKTKAYIRISSYPSLKGKRERNLYKFYQVNSGVYLIPLNPLNLNEVGEFSVNNENNKHFSYSFYQQLIESAADETTVLRERNRETNSLYYDIIKHTSRSDIPKYAFPKRKNVTNNINIILDQANALNTKDKQRLDYVDPKEQAYAQKFVRDIKNSTDFIGDIQYTLIWNESFTLAALLKENNNVLYVNTEIGGEKVLVKVTRYKRVSFNKEPKSGYTAIEQRIVNQVKDAQAINPKVYKINIVTDPEVIDRYNQDGMDAIDATYEDAPSMVRGIRNFGRRNVGRVPLNDNSFDDIDRVGNYILNDISFNLSKKEDKNAADVFKRLAYRNVNKNSLRSISENKKLVYTSAANYYKDLSNSIIEQLNNFILTNGNKYKLNDPKLFEEITKEPEDVARLMKLMLNARTFGRTIQSIFGLDITGEDEEVQRAINSIKDSITKVRDSEIVDSAYKLLFDIYLVQEYSNNPMYDLGISSPTDTWRDANFFELNISDIRDMNNKEVQIVVKAVGTIINASRFAAIENQKKFREELDKLLKEFGDFDWDHIIDENGRLVLPYTQEFINDKKELNEKVTTARLEYEDAIVTGDENKIIDARVAFEKAQLERDEWRANNLEQLVVRQYYLDSVANRKRALKLIPREYATYKYLNEKLYKNYGDVRSLNDTERREREEILNKIQNLRSITDSEGNPKDEETQNKVVLLNNTIKRHSNIESMYFKYDETKEFTKILNDKLNIIKTYDTQHPNDSLERKLLNPEYSEAYYWIKDNTRRKLNKKVSERISNAFNAIKNKTNLSTKNPLNPYKKIYDKIDVFDRYDAYGIINGSSFEKYTEEHPDDDVIQQLHDITVASYNPFDSKGYIERPEHVLSDNNLIKDLPSDEEIPSFNDKFYAQFRGDEMKSPEAVRARQQKMKEINDLIAYGIDPNTGHISSELLFKNLTEDELKLLAQKYQELRAINSTMYDNLDSSNEVVNRTNDARYNAEFAWAEANLKNATQKKLWKEIFCDRKTNGKFRYGKGQKLLPNRMIYGYVTPIKKNIDGKLQFDPKYVDKKKTEARRFIKENISFVPTKHYWDAVDYHTKKGDFAEWYAKNHVYNPYTHSMEMLRIWTTMEVNPNLAGEEELYTFEPTFDNSVKQVKDGEVYTEIDEETGEIQEKELPDYRNKNYSEKSVNYAKDTSDAKYRNSKYNSLSEKEKKVIAFLQNTLNSTASSTNMRKFFNEGFVPRRYKPVIDAKWVASNVFGAVGLEMGNYRDRSWHDDISYEKDFEADFDMTRIIPAKGFEDYEEAPKKEYDETDAEYHKRLQELEKRNEEKRQRNLERERAIRDNQWDKVFEDYVGRITEYQARIKAKDMIYILLEDLKSRPAFKTNAIGTHIKTRKSSPVEETQYQTTAQNNTVAIVQNFARRVLFGEYKKINPAAAYADLMQNITSAKYMIFNVTGGISNVTTGLVNMMGEAFAGQYFSMSEFRKAQAQYFANAIGFIASVYSEKSPNLTIALTKEFNVVDFDAMVERKPGEGAAEWSNRIRNMLYGLQSSGEHYMQNTVLFAILKSHRIFTNVHGKKIAGNFNDYTININHRALQNIIAEVPEFVAKYNSLLNEAKRNKDIQMKYDMFQRDFCADFISSITDKKIRNQIAESYNKERKRLLKEAKVEFEKEPKVEDQFELVQGRVVVKKNSPLTKEMLGFIKDRVQIINKKIHGVYDKLGAAKIESEWWGGLIMQYHKHIYPGIMKRFRNQGYYNETRGSIERGSYISFWNLLTKDFDGIKKRIDDRKNDSTNAVLVSLQEVAKSAINCIINLKFNYSVMPIWEQQNIRRVLGDLLGIVSAIIMALTIYMMTDEDDREESDLINTGLYLADRLFSESQMYTPWGLIAEASTMWSSPIAAQNGPEDLLKGLSYIGKIIVDPEYDMTYQTGLYAGQNKLAILFLRNVPFYRVIQRLDNMSRNNSYYRINESSFSIGIAENIATKLKGEE